MMRSNETMARQLISELDLLSHKEDHKHGIIQTVFYKSWLKYRHEPPDQAIRLIDSALTSIDEIDNDTSLFKFYILKGQCYVKKQQFAQALDQFTKAMNVARSRNDQLSLTSTLISIGWAYMEDGKPKDAIRFFHEVLRLNPAENYENRAVLLNNIAACNNTLGEFRQAEYFAKKGIAAARSRNNQADLANGLNILARSYYQQGKIETAIPILKNAAKAREHIADPSMLASDYLELADLYVKNNQPVEAIQWAKKAEGLSAGLANNLKLAAAYKSLSWAYEQTGDHHMATFYLKKLLAHKDSLSDDHYNKAFAQMQVQYETQKKTAENLGLKKENLEAKLRNSNQQRWIMGLGGGSILILASGIYISMLMKSRYRTRLALEQLNEHKRRTMAVMVAEENQRRRLAGDLHDGVGQTLAAAALQLNKARKDPVSLEKVDELINLAGSEVRTLSHQVTPELLLHHGLLKAMEQAVDRLNDAHDQVQFHLCTHVEQALEDEMASLTIYRCFQELCTNIIRHAAATNVTIHLNLEQEEIELMIEDDGKGFDPALTTYGLGMKSMQSRLALYEGQMLVDSMPGRGTTTIIKMQRPH